MTSFDPSRIRDQFPALALEQDGRPVVYLDGPGGTQVPQRVIDAVVGYYRTMNANDGGAFQTSEATDGHGRRGARGGRRPAGRDRPRPGPFRRQHDHPHVPRQPLHRGHARRRGRDRGHDPRSRGERVALAGARRRPRPGRPDRGHPGRRTARWTWSSSARLLGPRTRLVAVGHGVQRPGHHQPGRSASREMAHAHGALVFVDAVHYVPHRGVDVATLGADLLVTSPYKWFGPHSGVLWAGTGSSTGCRPTRSDRPTARSRRAPRPSSSSPASMPRSTTRRPARRRGDRAPGRAWSRAMDLIADHEATLSRRFMDGLAAIPDLRLWGITDTARIAERTPTFGLTSASRTPREMAEALGARRHLRLGRPLLCPGTHRAAGSGRVGRRAAPRLRALQHRGGGRPDP